MMTLSELYRRYGIQSRMANKLIELGKLKIIQQAKGNGFPTLISEDSVKAYLNEEKSIVLSEVTKRLGISLRKANRLIELGKLELIARSKSRAYVTEKSVDAFISERRAFEETYILCKEAFKILNIKNLLFYSFLENHISLNENFNQEPDFFEILELPENYYGISDQRYYFKRRDLEILQHDYVTIEQAQKIIGVKDSSSFAGWLQRRPSIQIFSFAEKPRHAKFVKKSNLIDAHLNFKPKKPDDHLDKDVYISYKDTLKILNLSNHNFGILIKEKIIVPSKKIGQLLFFDKEEVYFLLAKQEEDYRQLSQNYYTRKQVDTLYPALCPVSLAATTNVRKILLSTLLSTLFEGKDDKWSVGKYLYHKEDVENFNNQILIQNATFNEPNFANPFDEYKRRLQINGISFTNKIPVTEQLWNEYSLEFLKSKDGQAYDVTGQIWCLIRIVEAFVESLDKEIYEYNAKELNLMLLNNEQIVRRAREEIYQFLVFVHKVIVLKQNKNPFNLEVLVNPRSLPRERLEKKIYTYAEYEALFKFAINLDIHKKAAVEQAITFAKKKDLAKYNGYDSIWLYILLHLNNAWRHSDCQDVPQISLEGTDIIDLQWLLNNDLSDEDVKKIIFRFKITPMIVFKTKAKRNFFCASEVERAIATAIVICQFRTKAYDANSKTIIFGISRSNGTMLRSKPLNVFFSKFQNKDHFTFSNRAMNRTVISLVQCIQSIYGKDTDSEYLRILRSHADFETTDIYNEIPQERMDTISMQLFDRDMFGHIPDVFSELLFGKSLNEYKQTKQIKAVRNSYGDIYKVEETAQFLNDMQQMKIHASRAFIEKHQEYKDVIEEIIRDMSPDEVRSLYHKIIARQMPSKTEHYQCIVSESNCKFPGRDCENCPLSIPHFYAISSLVERIYNKIHTIENSLREDQPKTELTRLANWLEVDLDLLKYAQNKYGKQEIAMFATGLNEKLKLIGPLRIHQTIKKVESIK